MAKPTESERNLLNILLFYGPCDFARLAMVSKVEDFDRLDQEVRSLERSGYVRITRGLFDPESVSLTVTGRSEARP